MENLSEKAKVMAESKFNYIESDPWSGITKREYFAGLAMQGIMAQFTEMAANGSSTINYAGMDKSIAKEAVSIADALLEALSKP